MRYLGELNSGPFGFQGAGYAEYRLLHDGRRPQRRQLAQRHPHQDDGDRDQAGWISRHSAIGTGVLRRPRGRR